MCDLKMNRNPFWNQFSFVGKKDPPNPQTMIFDCCHSRPPKSVPHLPPKNPKGYFKGGYIKPFWPDPRPTKPKAFPKNPVGPKTKEHIMWAFKFEDGEGTEKDMAQELEQKWLSIKKSKKIVPFGNNILTMMNFVAVILQIKTSHFFLWINGTSKNKTWQLLSTVEKITRAGHWFFCWHMKMFNRTLSIFEIYYTYLFTFFFVEDTYINIYIDLSVHRCICVYVCLYVGMYVCIFVLLNMCT